MRTPEDVYTDYCGRRQGIITALTSDVDRFYAQCDPERENLCLYGNPDSTFDVDLPAEEVPPEMPEPALGINFARDGMQVGPEPSHLHAASTGPLSACAKVDMEGFGTACSRAAADALAASQKKDWLSLVAVHSDTWLLAVAFYNGARLNREGRERLFELINEQPTCYEIVSGKASRDAAKPKKRGAPGQPARPPSMAPPAKTPRMVSLPAFVTSFSRALRPATAMRGHSLGGNRLWQLPAWVAVLGCQQTWRGLSSRLNCGLHSRPGSPARPPTQAGPGHGPRRHRDVDDEDDDEEDEGPVPGDDQYADGEGDPCPNCGRVYRWAPCCTLYICFTMPGLGLGFGAGQHQWPSHLFSYVSSCPSARKVIRGRQSPPLRVPVQSIA